MHRARLTIIVEFDADATMSRARQREALKELVERRLADDSRQHDDLRARIGSDPYVVGMTVQRI